MVSKFNDTLLSVTQSRSFVIGYSGGLDSHVLLHLMASLHQTDSSIQLTAVHINHGLSQHANQWQQHCLMVCEGLQLPCEVKLVSIEPVAGEGLEACARDLRYAAFAECMQPGDCLLTAHTRTDQVETLLLQLLRGAGVQGLAAMPLVKTFHQGEHLRPLLSYTRDELMSYAHQHGLNWIEDESNQDERFDRNYLRHQVMPLLQARWPAMQQTMARSAELCAEGSELLQVLGEQDYAQLKDSDCLLANELLQLSEVRQRNVLRYWIQQHAVTLPSQTIIQQIQLEVLLAAADAEPVVQWADVSVRRYQNRLYLLTTQADITHDLSYDWDMQVPLTLPEDLGELVAVTNSKKGVYLPKSAQVKVCFRQGGERFQPAGRVGSHPLKKLMQEWHIPPWQRLRVPLIYYQDQLIAVVGYAHSDALSKPFADNTHKVAFKLIEGSHFG